VASHSAPHKGIYHLTMVLMFYLSNIQLLKYIHPKKKWEDYLEISTPDPHLVCVYVFFELVHFVEEFRYTMLET
jgi:hypothetical protein